MSSIPPRRPARVRISFDLTPQTAAALAERARLSGCTEKQLLVRGLEALGVAVDPADRYRLPPRHKPRSGAERPL